MAEKNIPTREQQKAKELIEKFEKSCGPHLGVIAAEICVQEILDFASNYFGDAEIYWQKVLDEIQSV
jgi:hypothetical protein